MNLLVRLAPAALAVAIAWPAAPKPIPPRTVAPALAEPSHAQAAAKMLPVVGAMLKNAPVTHTGFPTK